MTFAVLIFSEGFDTKVNFVVAKQHADNNRQTFKHVKGLLVKVLTRVKTLM